MRTVRGMQQGRAINLSRTYRYEIVLGGGVVVLVAVLVVSSHISSPPPQ